MRSSRSRLEMLLQDYAAGDLDADAAAEAERLIAEDPKARALFEEIRAAHESLALLRERPEPPVSAADAMARIRAGIAAEAFARRPRLYLEGEGTRIYRRLAIAASLLFALSLSFFLLRSNPAPVERVFHPTPTGAERARMLNLVEAGRKDGMSAADMMRLVREMGMKPDEAVFRPQESAIPVSAPAPESR